MSGNFSILGPRKTTNQALFQVWNILNEHFGLLNLININKIDAELEYIKLVIEAKLHDASCCVNISLGIQILLRQVEKVVRADLQLQVLHIVMDHL